jgi:putative peptidoglycan lipid II flippase
VKVATISFVVNVVASLLLMRPFGATGLAAASTLAVLVQTVVMQQRLVKRLPHLAFAPLWRDVGKILLGTTALSLVVIGGWQGLQTQGRTGDLLALLVLIPVAAGIYTAVLWVVRVEGREQLRAMVLQRLGRK